MSAGWSFRTPRPEELPDWTRVIDGGFFSHRVEPSHWLEPR